MTTMELTMIDDVNDDDGGGDDDDEDDNSEDDDDNERIIGKHSPLKVNVLDSGWSDLGLRPGLNFCVVFMDKDFTLKVLLSIQVKPRLQKDYCVMRLQSIELHSDDVKYLHIQLRKGYWLWSFPDCLLFRIEFYMHLIFVP